MAEQGKSADMLVPSEVAKVQGEALSEDKLKELQKSGNLPMNIDMSMNPAIHKVKSGNEDVIVLMIDAPPCGCRKIGKGKKERCRIHRKEKRAKKAKKSKAKEAEVKAEPKKEAGLVKDDESDRKKLGALRHVEDSEEEHDAVDGAISPDKVCIVGPAGVGVLVPIESEGNKAAAPKASQEVKKGPIKGIMVLGAQDCPQFIPQDKIPMDNGNIAYAKYTAGTLVMNEKEEVVFYPDGGNKFDQKGNPVAVEVAGVDKKVQQKIGVDCHYAGVVDVNAAGMPEFRKVDEKNCAPQDKNALVGCLIVKDGVVQFVQTKGQAVGSGDQGALIPTTKEGAVPAGTVLGELVLDKKTGNIACVPKGEAVGKQVVATVVQGTFNEPVIVPIKEGPLAAGTTCATKDAVAFKDADWQKLVAQDEKVQKQSAPEVEKVNVVVQAAMLGCSPEQAQEINKNAGADVKRGCFKYAAPTTQADAAAAPTNANGAPSAPTDAAPASAGPQEIKSVAFGAANYGGSVFAIAKAKPAGGCGPAVSTGVSGPAGSTGGSRPAGSTGGSGAIGAAGSSGAAGPAGAAGPQEVKSVAFGGGNYGGSVFAMSQAKPVAGSAKPGTAVQPKGVMNGSTPVAAGSKPTPNGVATGAGAASTSPTPAAASAMRPAGSAPAGPVEVKSVAFYPAGAGGAPGSVFAIAQPKVAGAPAPKSGPVSPAIQPKGTMGGAKATSVMRPATTIAPAPGATSGGASPRPGAAAPMQYTVTNKPAGSSGGAGQSGGMVAAAGPQEVQSVACFGAGAAYAGANMSYHMTSANKAAAANQPTKMEVKSTSVTNNNGALQAYEARSQFIGK